MCIILRGLPGSGKSVIAKKFRDMEVQHGGEAPRLHALDDYFITVFPDLTTQSSSIVFVITVAVEYILCCVSLMQAGWLFTD